MSNKSIPFQIEKLYLDEERILTSSQKWIAFSKSYSSLREAVYGRDLPFDPRFNSVYWAFAVISLCREIAFGYCRMNAYARYYKGQVRAGTRPSDVDFHVSYFADNCMTRIDSCRDKIALMVWAFYCPFNPEKRPEILDYETVLDRLKHQLRVGLTPKNNQEFLRQLDILRGQDFERVVKYRNCKIHRMEPRIEIYGVKMHHSWDYMFPLYDKREIEKWEKELAKHYPEKEFREHIKKGCRIDGILFERRKIKGSLWSYSEVRGQIRSCLFKLLSASAGCFDIFTKRAPLKRSKRG